MARNITVKRGDTLLSIADEHGFFDWKYVWDQNSTLHDERPDPNVLAPGDVLAVPDIRPKEYSGSTNQVHKFRYKKAVALVDLVLRNELGFKLPNTKFELRTGEDQVYTGTSNSDGRICVGLSPKTKEAVLTVWPFEDDPDFTFSWRLKIGNLDPIVNKNGNATSDISGIQSRLNNLGFDAGTESGSMNDLTKKALLEFQKYVGLDSPTGDPDDETRRLLESVHNSL